MLIALALVALLATLMMLNLMYVIQQFKSIFVPPCQPNVLNKTLSPVLALNAIPLTKYPTELALALEFLNAILTTLLVDALDAILHSFY